MSQLNGKQIKVEVSVGELLDKISILEIKKERIKDPFKLENIRRELMSLKQVQQSCLPLNHNSQTIYQELKSVNEALWEIEDDIRNCEREKCFSQKFIVLARSVYKQNDLRCRLKRQLNEAFGSRLVEEKSYAEYSFNA